MAHAIGIDLGTTKSMAAYVNSAGQPESIPAWDTNANGPLSHLVPSVVYFGEKLLVGEAALVAGLADPEGLATGFKRDIGKPHFHRLIRHCQVPAEVLSGLLLEYLATCIRQQPLDLHEVVITVPAHFDAHKRTTTQQAADLAGLRVLDIVNEPTAAAIGAAHQVLMMRPEESKSRRILVYDFGGGTFDVTVLELQGRVFKTIATDGDIRLGGMDFDECVIQLIRQQFISRHGVDPATNPSDVPRLWQLARQTKHALSRDREVKVSYQTADLLHGFVLTRSDFEQAIDRLVARTMSTTEDVVQAAGLTWDDIDDILLAGGSSRIPLVAQRMYEHVGRQPRLVENPDELVAHGAALYAASRTGQQFQDTAASFSVVNVNSHSLGVQSADPHTKLPTNHVLIPRNTPLPATAKRECVTLRDGQRTVKLRLLEGESENPKYCTVIGDGVVRLDQPVPEKTKVIVECQYAANGTITLAARVPHTQASAYVELRRDGLSLIEPLSVWRSRLTTGEQTASELKANTPNILPQKQVSIDTRNVETVLKRLDELYAYIGAKAIQSNTIPVRAMNSKRLYQRLCQEIATLKEVVQAIERRHQQEVDLTARWRLSGDLASAKVACEQATRMVCHCRVAVGRDCVIERVIPADSDVYLPEIQHLESVLHDDDVASK